MKKLLRQLQPLHDLMSNRDTGQLNLFGSPEKKPEQKSAWVIHIDDIKAYQQNYLSKKSQEEGPQAI